MIDLHAEEETIEPRPFRRTDRSLIGRWWWGVDRLLVGAFLLMMAIGAFLVMAGSPPAAQRLHLPNDWFIERHLRFLPIATMLLLLVSMASARGVLLAGLAGFFLTAILTGSTPWLGDYIKGARRWIELGELVTIQPGEFLKYAFVIVNASLLMLRLRIGQERSWLMSLALYGLTVLLLLRQPDVGMVVVVTVIWVVMLTVAGLSVAGGTAIGALGLIGLGSLYWTFPHVEARVDQFLRIDPAPAEQITIAQRAFRESGLWGRGPGEGVLKNDLPDSHSDFIFAVAAEEFGILACIAIAVLYGAITWLVLRRLRYVADPFSVLAGVGLAASLALQALVNMSSTLGMIPTKGMTLPFMSYGGSSLLASSIAAGCILALLRRNNGSEWTILPPAEPLSFNPSWQPNSGY